MIRAECERAGDFPDSLSQEGQGMPKLKFLDLALDLDSDLDSGLLSLEYDEDDDDVHRIGRLRLQ